MWQTCVEIAKVLWYHTTWEFVTGYTGFTEHKNRFNSFPWQTCLATKEPFNGSTSPAHLCDSAMNAAHAAISNNHYWNTTATLLHMQHYPIITIVIVLQLIMKRWSTMSHQSTNLISMVYSWLHFVVVASLLLKWRNFSLKLATGGKNEMQKDANWAMP